MKKRYSGKQVIRAGEKLLDDKILDDQKEFSKATDTLSYWRFSHEDSLNIAFSLVQQTALKHDKKAIFAKRLKRFISIVNKLKRFRKMKLKNMQDIGGCRVITSNEKKLRKILRDLKKNQAFKHNGRYRTKDYIKSPKEDGYRSYHIVGKFAGEDGERKSIEVQLRTQIQHYWATALEIVDIFTDQALKSNQGDENWKDFFVNVSKQFAVMEAIHMFENMDADKKQKMYEHEIEKHDGLLESCTDIQNQSKRLRVVERLEVFAGSLQVVDKRMKTEELGQGYVLLVIDILKSTVSSTFYPDENSKDAEEAYIEGEKMSAGGDGQVVALVSTSAVGDIREAYPNYFADSTEFLKHLILIHNVKGKKPKGIFENIFDLDRAGDLS